MGGSQGPLGLKPWDLLPLFLAVALSVSLSVTAWERMEGETLVEIRSEEGTFVFPMHQDRYFSARGPLGNTVIRIQGEEAWFESSPCPNQLCIQAGHQHRPGQWAACLPNRVFLRILSRRTEVDALAQ